MVMEIETAKIEAKEREEILTGIDQKMVKIVQTIAIITEETKREKNATTAGR